MKRWVAMMIVAGGLAVSAQTVVSPYRALRPIMKDPNQRNAPTSLNQYPNESAAPSTPRAAAAPSAPAKPVEIVAKIQAGLAASTISLIGTVDGLKGRMYITNLGTEEITPKALFAVCNLKGFQVGSTTKMGTALAPNEAERIDVLATNSNAVDLKLMKLTGSQKN